jgi:hypothetical protein
MKRLLVLILLIGLFGSIDTIAQELDKTASITVSGSGKTQDEAKQTALRSAIEQAYGAFISSKIEILNDQIISEQITSVSSGNIQSYTLLNESQLPNGNWGITINVVVSISKLTSFVKSKGITIEIGGGLFALNIKQQKLNEDGEIKAITEMVGLIHENMQSAFDYEISSINPKSLDNDQWEIPLVVKAKTNNNIDFCGNYCMNVLAALSLSSDEVANYKNLNKPIFQVTVDYSGRLKPETYYLRKKASFEALKSLGGNWEFYNNLFLIESNLNTSIKNLNIKELRKFYANDYDYPHRLSVYERMSEFSKNRWKKDYGENYFIANEKSTLFFFTKNQVTSIFETSDTLTLKQIENLEKYSIKPKGIISKFKKGGYVIFEKDGHGLIMAITDLEEERLDWVTADEKVKKIIINGTNNWRLPTIEELKVKLKEFLG